jgi:signal transduction histidine kinase
MDERPIPTEPGSPAPEGGDQDLRRRLELMSEAAALFAHDLKNPLSALLLGVQRLARLADPPRQAQARDLAARLERSIQAMSRLVEGHADLARLQAGQLQLERARLPCAEVLVRAVESLRPAATERKQELRLDLSAPLPEVEWDGARVAEALAQLLGTALRLGPEGAAVACTAAVAGPEVIVTVTVEHAASPSAPDLQPTAPPARRIRGSGLLVARGLVEAHGGRLTIEDDLQRTTARVFLPARP